MCDPQNDSGGTRMHPRAVEGERKANKTSYSAHTLDLLHRFRHLWHELRLSLAHSVIDLSHLGRGLAAWLCEGAHATERLGPVCRCCSTLAGPSAFQRSMSRWLKISEQCKDKTNLAILICLTNVDERPPPALVLFAAHDGVHRANRAVERNRGAGLALSGFGLQGRRLPHVGQGKW